MLFYRAALPLSRKTLDFVAGIIRRHRASIGSLWRKLNPGQQALLVLAHLRKRETFAELAAGFGVGTAGLHRFDPDGQVWARSMADLLIDANARAGNAGKRTPTALDGARLARRFRDHEDMILRFATDLAVGFTSNQAERDVRPVKVQQRSSGGTWRTLLGLADFAIVQSYLATTAKWGIDALDALIMLFTDGPWLPPAVAPP